MQKIKFLSDMRARIQTIPTGGGGGSNCFSREVRIASRGRFVPVFLLGNKWQLMIFMGRSGPPAPLSPPISEFQTVWIHILFFIFCWAWSIHMGAQWLSGRVLDSRLKGREFEPHRRHCVVVLEQDTFILA